MNELALFAGAGGGILGGKLLGWRTVCAVEIDAFCREVLLRRQLDGCLPKFPIWDDIRTFDGKPWAGLVDVISGGFPCQDISCAGKGKGIEGEQSGLWSEMARIIGEIRPAFAFVENSPELVRRGLTTVVSRFAEMGYDSKWGVIGARHLSAMHKRDRLWIVATNIQDANSVRRNCELGRYVSRSRWKPKYAAAYLAGASDREPWILGRHHGVAYIMDRLKSIGNGQVPAVAALSWNVLTDNMDTNAKNMEAHGQD